MDMATALQIVVELARQNMVDRDEMPEIYETQNEAINMIEDMAVNVFGDD